MSYAEIASKGPKQTPEEAAAPRPPQIEVADVPSSSTGSLIDVDTPSVRTVPSDFGSQEIKTETQAERIEIDKRFAEEEDRAWKAATKAQRAADAVGETETADAAKSKDGGKKKKHHHHHNKDKAKAVENKAKEGAVYAENVVVRSMQRLWDERYVALVTANWMSVVAISGYLGYKGWILFDKGRLDRRAVGLGLGIMGVVGAVESLIARSWNKALAEHWAKQAAEEDRQD